MAYSDKKLIEICKSYNKYGEIKTAEVYGITIESVKRAVRKAKEIGIYTESANNQQSKYLNRILEQY